MGMEYCILYIRVVLSESHTVLILTCPPVVSRRRVFVKLLKNSYGGPIDSEVSSHPVRVRVEKYANSVFVCLFFHA